MRCKLLAACLILGAWVAPARAQTFPMPDYFHELIFSPQPPQPLPDTKGFRDYIVDGKLRLSLQDAMLLLLEHSTEVHIDRLAVTDAEFNVERAFANFDPALASTFNTDRTIIRHRFPAAGRPHPERPGTANDVRLHPDVADRHKFQYWPER